MSMVKDKLKDFVSLKLKMEFLSDEYPSLFIYILQCFDMSERIEHYMAKCEAY